ncbi:MAG TPA: hypothetical protein VK797_22150 [Tepidisphaeraceae bacterium]|nr:hypothetical protein [Tepidisphaeraceae bacterium]
MAILTAGAAPGNPTDYAELQAAVRSAEEVRAKALQDCSQRLHATPQYKVAKELTDQTEREFIKARESGTAQEKLDASHDYVAAKSALKKLQDDAVSEDTRLNVAEVMLASANARLAAAEAKDGEADKGVGTTAAKRGGADGPGTTARKTNKQQNLVEEYDRFRDISDVGTPRMPLDLDAGVGRHFMRLWVAFSGQKLTETPDHVLLMLTCTHEGWVYLKVHDHLELILMIDGQRTEIPIKNYDSNIGDYVSGHCIELLTFRLSADVVRAITQARRVEAQVFATEFTFTPDQIENISELAAYTGIATSK